MYQPTCSQQREMAKSPQDNHEIEVYYTPDEFKRFLEFEKLRLEYVKKNYEIMIETGLNVSLPDFMIGSDDKVTIRRKSGNKASSLKKPGRQEKQATKKPATASRPSMNGSDDAFEKPTDITIARASDDSPGSSRPTKELQSDTAGNKASSLKKPGRQEKQATKKPAIASRPSMNGSDDAFEQPTDITIARASDDSPGSSRPTKELKSDTGSKRLGLRRGTVRSFNHQCHCGKEFLTLCALVIHTRVHTGERPYQCTKCEKNFNNKGNLKRHIIHVHQHEHGERIKLYKCDSCEKEFAHKHVQKRHMRIHTGEKPYKCNTCGKVFRQKKTLVNHERIHSGMKPFQCTHCEKTFRKKYHREVHLRVHTGETPYKCTVCDQGFKQNVLLKTHMRRHHGEIV